MGEVKGPATFTPFDRLNNYLQTLGCEARGIQRVQEEERLPKMALSDYLAMCQLWFSVNCTANNMTVGVLGGVSFGLGFVDATLYV